MRRSTIKQINQSVFLLIMMTADVARSFAGSRTKGADTTSEAQSILPLLYTYQHLPQKRRKPNNRRPKFYWQSIDNVRLELASFWAEHGVQVDQSCPPIPSEKILNFFGLNGLRWAIAQLGGRENVAHQLGGVLVIPGKWEEAKELDEVKGLLPYMANHTTNDEKGMEKTRNVIPGKWEEAKELDEVKGLLPYMANHTTNDEKGMEKTRNARRKTSENSTISSLASQEKAIKTHFFWSKENSIKELYRYLESYKVLRRRPSVWMPKPEEIKTEGSLGLFNALKRFNKLPNNEVYASIFGEEESVRRVAGLVPFQEWR